MLHAGPGVQGHPIIPASPASARWLGVLAMRDPDLWSPWLDPRLGLRVAVAPHSADALREPVVRNMAL